MVVSHDFAIKGTPEVAHKAGTPAVVPPPNETPAAVSHDFAIKGTLEVVHKADTPEVVST